MARNRPRRHALHHLRVRQGRLECLQGPGSDQEPEGRPGLLLPRSWGGREEDGAVSLPGRDSTGFACRSTATSSSKISASCLGKHLGTSPTRWICLAGGRGGKGRCLGAFFTSSSAPTSGSLPQVDVTKWRANLWLEALKGQSIDDEPLSEALQVQGGGGRGEPLAPPKLRAFAGRSDTGVSPPAPQSCYDRVRYGNFCFVDGVEVRRPSLIVRPGGKSCLIFRAFDAFVRKCLESSRPRASRPAS